MTLVGERVAITGLGMVSALGPLASRSFERICRGEHGIEKVTLFETSGLASELAAEVPEFEVEPGLSRTDALALRAAEEALRSAGIDPRSLAVGLAIGGTTGGMLETEAELARQPLSDGFARARRLLTHPLSTTERVLEQRLGPFARTKTICSACSSGAVAAVLGAHWIEHAGISAVLAGGADSLCRMTFAGFSSLGVVAKERCRPFDVRRAGLTLGEGAAFLVLEAEESARRRGAEVLAWLTGWAIGAESHHMTHPEPDGARATALILEALRRAQLSPAEVDYVNAHGTGTPANDAMEALAIQRALGEHASRVRVSSSKGQLGHTLGAAGAVEAVISVLALERGLLPPTGGLERPEATGLRHVCGRAEAAEARAVISNSFGFGGMDTVLVFERADAERRPRRSATPTVVVSAACAVADEILTDRSCAACVFQPSPSGGLSQDPLSLLDPSRSRRFDRNSALSALAAAATLQSSGLGDVSELGLVLGSAFGSVERSLKFIDRLLARGMRSAAPAEFPQLVHSAAAANTAIYLGLQGPVLAVCQGSTTAEAAFDAALSLIESGVTRAALAGAVDAWDPVIHSLAPELLPESLPRCREGGGFVLFELESRARERGRRPLARLVSHEVRSSGLAASSRIFAPPFEPSTARVVLASSSAALVARISESAWSSVRCHRLTDHVGFCESIGGLALAASAAWIADGASEVLCAGGDGSSHYFFRLRRIENE